MVPARIHLACGAANPRIDQLDRQIDREADQARLRAAVAAVGEQTKRGRPGKRWRDEDGGDGGVVAEGGVGLMDAMPQQDKITIYRPRRACLTGSLCRTCPGVLTPDLVAGKGRAVIARDGDRADVDAVEIAALMVGEGWTCVPAMCTVAVCVTPNLRRIDLRTSGDNRRSRRCCSPERPDTAPNDRTRSGSCVSCDELTG